MKSQAHFYTRLCWKRAAWLSPSTNSGRILMENCLIQSFVAGINRSASQPSLIRCKRSCKDKNSMGHCAKVQGTDQLLHFDSDCAFMAVSKTFNLCFYSYLWKFSFSGQTGFQGDSVSQQVQHHY